MLQGDIRRRAHQTGAVCRRVIALVSLMAVCASMLVGGTLVLQLFRAVEERGEEVVPATSGSVGGNDAFGRARRESSTHGLLRRRPLGRDQSDTDVTMTALVKGSGTAPSPPSTQAAVASHHVDSNAATRSKIVAGPQQALQRNTTPVHSSSSKDNHDSSTIASTEASSTQQQQFHTDTGSVGSNSSGESFVDDHDANRSMPFTFSPPTALRVAATILVGSGNRVEKGESEESILDGACTLRHTMLAFRPKHAAALDFFILVDSNVSLAPKSIWILQQCGYQLRVSTTGIDKGKLEEVPVLLRKAIAARAVGTLELLKLECLKMVEYDVVISLDADIMIVAPYADLVELPYVPEAPYRLSTEFNGGLNVFFPKNDGPVHAERIINILFTVPWTRETGFGETGYGQTANARISGGPMLQGLLPYYLHTLDIHPALGRLIVPPCRHNFFWAPKKKKLRYCLQLRLRDIASVHFKGSGFPKPWECAQLNAKRSECPVASWESRRLYRNFGAVYRKAITAAEHENRCSYFHNRFLAEHTAMLQHVLNVSKAVARNFKNGCLEETSDRGDSTSNTTFVKLCRFVGIEYHLRSRWKKAASG